MNTLYFWLLVQFSSSAEVSERGTPAGGLSKLSSVDKGTSALDASGGARPLMDAGPVDI